MATSTPWICELTHSLGSSQKREERNHHMHHTQIYTCLQTSSFVKKLATDTDKKAVVF